MTSTPSAEAVHAATAERWDLSGVAPVAHPGWLACPVCRTPEPLTRWWQFHERPGPATVPWRCDISFKCVSCAAVWVHGVALTEDAWNRRPEPRSKRMSRRYTRRQIEEF